MCFLLKFWQACRGSRNSKSAVQKVSKQVAQAFLKRTLGRCRRYEEAGVSCFSEPTLQNIMFAPHSRENGGQPADCIVSGTASNTCNKALHQFETRKLGISFFFTCFCIDVGGCITLLTY
jgi:hypothetical protein